MLTLYYSINAVKTMLDIYIFRTYFGNEQFGNIYCTVQSPGTLQERVDTMKEE